MENDANKRGYLLEDYRLFHLNDAQGAKVDYHYHDFCKLLFLRSGSGGYMIDGKRYALESADVVLIPNRCVHRPEFESGRLYERTIVYIDPDYLSRNSIAECDFRELFENSGNSVLRPDSHTAKRLFHLVDQLEKDLATEGFGHQILCNTSLLRLLVFLGQAVKNAGVFPQVPAEQAVGRMLDIQRYIDAHLEEDLSIDMLAERFFVSKYHMMRQFHKETGVPIHTYITDRRLFLARDRIRQGMSATDSCFCSGFRSYSSFTRAYAKRFGTTPTGRAERVKHREETFE